MDQFLFICALKQFLVGIEKLSHISQQHYFCKIYVNRVCVCYVKLSRKRPNFEKTKPAWTCQDSNTIFTPAFTLTRDQRPQTRIIRLTKCATMRSLNKTKRVNLKSHLYRHVAKSKNLGGQVVMRRAAAARRRLLFCQNVGGNCPPFIKVPDILIYKL